MTQYGKVGSDIQPGCHGARFCWLLEFPQAHCRLARTHRCMPNAEKGHLPIDMTSDLKDGPCV